MTAAHDTQALAACPFCEGRARFVKHSAGMKATVGYDQWDAVACSRCGATVGACDRRFRNKDDAAKAWDLRAALASRIQEKEGQPSTIAWEATTSAYITYITQERYSRFAPAVQRWYKPYRCSSCATLAAGSQAVQVPERIAELIDQHGSLRAAARALDCDPGYLSRLQSGEKSDPGTELLSRMGLRQVITFERIKP
ncbi:Lar family restriction alleviation protein [Variovorax sp. LT1R16]|uniref:Lar family restriction alleviation protein n=1 Tax=Variovorax sp. LT1R16 TaxID=3443728 RepID=UPI003F44F710